MKKVLTLVALLSLAACGDKGKVESIPTIVPQPVAVGVDAPCVPDTLGPAPEYVDSDAALKAAPDAAERYQLLWGGRAQRSARLGELEPVIAGCPRGKAR